MRYSSKVMGLRSRKGEKNRLLLVCRIDPATSSQLAKWQKQKVSQGVLIDRLTSHALRTNFNPAAFL